MRGLQSYLNLNYFLFIMKNPSKENLSIKLAEILNDENCPASAPIEIVDILINVLNDDQLKKVIKEFESPIWN